MREARIAEGSSTQPLPDEARERKVGGDWRLRTGVASLTNFCIVLVLLIGFPVVMRWTGALPVTEISPRSPQHTRAVLRFCSVVTGFLWTCFAIALVGIRRRGKITWRELVGAEWGSGKAVLGNLVAALGALLTMAVIGNISNALLGPLQHDSAAFHLTVAQNAVEAFAFLGAALSAGFVEEFVFRGYIQRQFQTLSGNTVVACALQLTIFTLGHFYQGWTRLIPVFLIGVVLTVVALWRRTLLPGMVAHGLGDGLVALAFFLKHLSG
jgi:membrane protease YdiL (CAAX protease family)